MTDEDTECNDYNKHRLCHAHRRLVMKQAITDPHSLQKHHSPYHHPIRPMLMSGEERTHVQAELGIVTGHSAKHRHRRMGLGDTTEREHMGFNNATAGFG